MTQRQMNYDESNQYEPPSSYATGYEEVPHPNTRPNAPLGYITLEQKLHIQDKGPSAGQRLALAIVSLAFLFVVFVITALGAASGGFLTFLQFTLTLGFTFFFVAVLVINIVFNRKH